MEVGSQTAENVLSLWAQLERKVSHGRGSPGPQGSGNSFESRDVLF